MFDVGFSELLFLGVIVIIVLGPERFPELIRYFIRLKMKFNKIKYKINSTLENELQLTQLKDELESELSNIKKLEEKLQIYFDRLNSKEKKGDQFYYPIEVFEMNAPYKTDFLLKNFSVHDKFHRTLILSGFCLLKIAKISLNSSFFPKPIKR